MARKRRSSLLRTAGRTAVISGVATAASGRVARRQQQKFAAQHGASASAASREAERAARHSDPDDLVGSLQRLAALHDSGDLSDQEFKTAKAKLLA
jgi:hypothetical protein